MCDKSIENVCETKRSELNNILFDSETLDEMFGYLQSIESPVGEIKINPEYRLKVVKWLIEVHFMRKQANPKTLFLAVYIFDRIVSMRPVPNNIIQLVGIASYYLSSKYEDIYNVQLDFLEHVCLNNYTRKQIVDAELLILNYLKFELFLPTSFDFIYIHIERYYSGKNQVTMKEYFKYLLSSLLSTQCMYLKPSLVANGCAGIINNDCKNVVSLIVMKGYYSNADFINSIMDDISVYNFVPPQRFQ